MKKSIPRLVLYILLLIKACAVVIPEYDNIPLLISVAVVMIALAVAVFINTTHSMSKHMLWYIGAAIVLFFGFPNHIPDFSDVGEIMVELIEGALISMENPTFLVPLIILIALQLFFRRNDSRILMIVRYIAICFVLTSYSKELFGYNNQLYGNLILITSILCLVYELNGCVDGVRRPRVLACTAFILFCMLVHMLFGYRTIMEFTRFIALDGEYWLYAVLAVLVVGLLLLYENWNNVQVLKEPAEVDSETGGALVCWCLAAVAMRMWNSVANEAVLYCLFPLAFHFYCVYLHSCRQDTENNQKNIFAKSWVLILFGLLTFAKGMNYAQFTAITMLVLFVGGYLCWNISGRMLRKPQVMSAFLGVAAVILMASLSFRSLEQLQDNVGSVLTILIASVMWIYVCTQAGKVNANASEAYPAEYKYIYPMQRIGAMITLVIVAIRVLAL